MLRGRFFVDTV